MESLIINKKSTLLGDNSSNVIVTDSTSMLKKEGFADDYVMKFRDDAVGILNDYAKLVGVGTEVRYTLIKRLLKIELKVMIPGEEYDPFNNGSGARERAINKAFDLNLNTQMNGVSYLYSMGHNIISVSIPLANRKKKLLKDPMIWAVVLGVALGLICQQLPEAANSFIVDEIASPMMSIILGMISGIMGPVIFISMITAIVSLGSVEELTNLGFRIFRRFFVVILFCMAVSVIVSAAFFRNFGNGVVDFSPKKIVEFFFNIFPTNMVEPFLNSNTPQLVVLGFIMGIALLLLGNRAKGLNDMLHQVNAWAMSAMKLVLLITPALPFLSIMTTLASGNGTELIHGWKFILASYIAYTICVAVKAIKTSHVTKMSVKDTLIKIEPAAKVAFTTGSTAAPMEMSHTIADKEFGIKPEFSSFWRPMCSAMMSIKTAINVIIATFMVAELADVPISTSFLLALIIMTLELSLASPGTTSAWTIVFESLALPTGYVGLLTAYRLFVENYSAASTVTYNMMEEYEAAYKLNGMKGKQPAASVSGDETES